MKKYIAYCGLDCEKCEARQATIRDDDALKEKVAAEWSALNQVKITPDMIHCVGCHVDGVKTPFCESLCPIRQCALNHGFETCGDCAELPRCEKIGMIIQNNPDTLNNLK